MGTFFAGTLYAFSTNQTLQLTQFFLMGFATLCIDMGTTGFNTYFDYLNGTDTKTLNQEEDKVLVHERVNPLAAFCTSILLFAIAGVLGLFLAYLTTWKLLVFGGVSMAVGFAYTGGPFPISRTPFGELFAGFFLGSVLFLLSFFVQTSTLPLFALLAPLPFFLLIALILSVNNSCDRKSDILSGRKTLSILLDKKGNEMLLMGEFFLAFFVSVVLVIMQVYPLLFSPFLLIAFLFGFLQGKAMVKRGFSEQTKQENMIQVSRIYLVYCLCFLFGIALDMVVGYLLA